MLRLIIQVLLAVIVFRLVGSVVSMFRHRGRERGVFEGGGDPDRMDRPDYRELTPYEIEDAEYEDLPKRD